MCISFSNIIALLALFISVLTYIRNENVSKSSLLDLVLQNINSVKSEVESLSVQFSMNKKLNATQQKILDSAIERLFNMYDDGCSKFYLNKIPKREFREKFNKDISDYFNKFESYFREPKSPYSNMIRYYRENIKMENRI